MLVLSRKVGEEIVIDGNIRVVINRVAGDRVTLAFKAPDDVRILRAELAPNEPAPVPPKSAAIEKPQAKATNPALAAAIAEPKAPKLPVGPRFKTVKSSNRLSLMARRSR